MAAPATMSFEPGCWLRKTLGDIGGATTRSACTESAEEPLIVAEQRPSPHGYGQISGVNLSARKGPLQLMVKLGNAESQAELG